MSKNNVTAHTQGPWIQAPLSPLDIVSGTDVNKDTMIAYAREGLNTISREEALANARLIASAPELLAALENLCRMTVWTSKYDREQVAAARAVIAKATGVQS